MAAQRIIDPVSPDRWHSSTHCTEWDASQVANHILGEHVWAGELVQGKTVAEVGNALDGDLTAEDPAAAYRRSVGVARKTVEAPAPWRPPVTYRSATTRVSIMRASCSWTS
jgi:uncharacterized protein (TIGR03083 family)